MPPLEVADPLYLSRLGREDFSDSDWEWEARKHFPNLAGSVVPRESDEYPTYWEGQ